MPRRVVGLAVLLGVALYVCLLAHFIHACASGSDPSGYLLQARELSAGRTSFPPRIVPGLDTTGLSSYLYAPLGASPSPVHPGEFVPTYPIGMPLFIAAAHLLVGWDRAFDFVILAHSLLGLGLVFALGRALAIGAAECLAAIVLLATGPLYVLCSLQGMSDLPALAWNTATALALWRARKNVAWAAAAGAALSVSVLIRPNDMLMLAPLLVAWWPYGPMRPEGSFVRRAALLVAGGVPGCILWLSYNRLAYGGVLATGYGDVGGLFRANLLVPTLGYYARWIPVVFSPVSLLCLGLPWVARRSRAATFLAIWAGAYLAFFVTNRYMYETWRLLRYILPAAPALVLGAVMVGRLLLDLRWMQAVRWPRMILGIALAGALAGQFVWDGALDVLYAGRGEETYPLAMSWLNANLPAGSIVLTMQASGSVNFYTHFTLVRWDELNAESFRRLAEAARLQGRALYAPLFEFERQQAMGLILQGAWQPEAKVRQLTIWRYVNPASR
jgi:hypothetical protein